MHRLLLTGATAPAVTAKLAAPNGTLGYGLVAVNLLLDGYTNSSQVTACHLMYTLCDAQIGGWLDD